MAEEAGKGEKGKSRRKRNRCRRVPSGRLSTIKRMLSDPGAWQHRRFENKKRTLNRRRKACGKTKKKIEKSQERQSNPITCLIPLYRRNGINHRNQRPSVAFSPLPLFQQTKRRQEKKKKAINVNKRSILSP